MTFAYTSTFKIYKIRYNKIIVGHDGDKMFCSSQTGEKKFVHEIGVTCSSCHLGQIGFSMGKCKIK